MKYNRNPQPESPGSNLNLCIWQMARTQRVLYLLLEQLQWADFCLLEHHGNIVGIPCCLDPGQLILHQDSIRTYGQRQKGCSNT